MKYAIQIRPSASKALAKVTKKDRLRLQAAIELLADNPHPPASKKLKSRDEFSVRVGDYRILYQVFEMKLIIEVIALGHRRAIYKNN